MSGLFDKLPRTRPPRRLGHVIDAGDGDPVWARLRCKRGHVWEIHGGHTVTELKRGIPCSTCADQAITGKK